MGTKGNLMAESCMFFMCDMQDKFRPSISFFDSIAENAQRLATASNVLNIPLVATEQYPKGLGKTIAEIQIDHAVGVFEKTKFSMVIPEVEKVLLEKNDRHQIVLFGVETHVCIQQSAIDLINLDKQVYLVADASSSRSNTDRLYALKRLEVMGAVVTTTESILFQLIGDKNHEKFKEIQSLIKSLPPDTGLC